MEQYLVHGDQVIFLPNFLTAIVVPVPGVIMSSATKTFVTGKLVCLEGDEKKVKVENVAYTNPPFVIPGTGTLSIQSLNADQISKKTTVEGKAPLLMGTLFVAKFTVSNVAKVPTPKGPQDDVVMMFTGQGNFTPTNMTVTDMS